MSGPRHDLGPAGLLRRHMGGTVAALVAAPLLTTLGACASIGRPDRLTLSQAELQNLLQARFPLEQRLLELFEVRASSPQLRLLPERNRLQALLDLQTRERLMGHQFKGRLDFDAALRWEPADNSVRLDQVRVQDFVLEAPARGGLGGVPSAGAAGPQRRSTSTERVAAALAERVLENMVLYRLPEDRLAQLHQHGVQPGALNVTRQGLEITFVPKTR